MATDYAELLGRLRSLGAAARGYPYGDYRQGYAEAIAAVLEVVLELVSREPTVVVPQRSDAVPRALRTEVPQRQFVIRGEVETEVEVPRATGLASIVDSLINSDNWYQLNPQHARLVCDDRGWTLIPHQGDPAFLAHSEWIQVHQTVARNYLITPDGWLSFVARREARRLNIEQHAIQPRPAQPLLASR